MRAVSTLALRLQTCFFDLTMSDVDGLGEDDDCPVDLFIEGLRKRKASVAFFGLTLESLLDRLILPDAERPIFVRMMQEKLGLGSVRELIAERL